MKARYFIPFIFVPLLSACGQNASNSSASTTTTVDKGESTFKKTCVLCHKSGLAGAPKIGNKTDWERRISQGNDILYEHSLKGFKGSKGFMPPKGGDTSLSDADVKAAVDFMVEKSR